jgi:DNA-directed RNA polymerase specialized sigma24 family protein
MSQFNESVLALCQDVLGGPAVEQSALTLVQRGLLVQLRTRYPTLGGVAEDLADEAICRLVERTAAGTIRLDDHPGAYLRVVADRLALQWLRSAELRHRAPGGEVPETASMAERDDDPIAQLIGRLSDIADVHRAFESAIDARDWHATRVLQVYIDQAARAADWPQLREVAVDAGVSHPTVRAVLRYTASFLREDHERWRRTGQAATGAGR